MSRDKPLGSTMVQVIAQKQRKILHFRRKKKLESTEMSSTASPPSLPKIALMNPHHRLEIATTSGES
jgi:hypothetical protein